jgi:hypothetical protein
MAISMKQFYLWGSILLSVSVLGSAWNIKALWLTITIGAKISMIANLFFQVLLAVLFFGLYLQLLKQTKTMNNPELDKFLQELQHQDKLKGGLKNEQKNYIKNKP